MNEVAGFSEESLRKIAEQKVNYRRSVKIHWMAYILVNIFLVILNLLSGAYVVITRVPAIDPQIALGSFWVLYPILGWFIGLMMHTVAYIMYAKGVYPFAKRGVVFHITAYLTVMLLLLMTNYITTPQLCWVIFPGIFWGMGVIAHIVVYNVYLGGSIDKGEPGKTRKELAVDKEIDKMKNRMKK